MARYGEGLTDVAAESHTSHHGGTAVPRHHGGTAVRVEARPNIADQTDVDVLAHDTADVAVLTTEAAEREALMAEVY